jgi:hypothetical protein
MFCVILHFIRRGHRDEVLKISRVGRRLYRCSFFPSDLESSYSFVLNRRELLNYYITDTLRMVSNDDMDPYDEIQVSTVMHPAILFHSSELSKEDVFDRVYSMIDLAIRTPLEKNGLSESNQ